MKAGDVIEYVGGPAHGTKLTSPGRGWVSTTFMSAGLGSPYIEQEYTVRRCWRADGSTVEILAPAGQLVDKAWLAANGLTN